MIFKIKDNKLKINSLNEFNPKHIFECGQVFAYKKIDEETYIFYPNDKVYLVYKKNSSFIIHQASKNGRIEETISIFDLENNYQEIREKINVLIGKKDFKLNKEIIKSSLKFGYGIRILKQEVIETIISFIFSQNNSIKRIKNSLDKLRESYGEEIKINFKKIKDKHLIEKIENLKFYSFPKLNKLKNLDENFFESIGAGYRAKYLVQIIKELVNTDFEKLRILETKELRNKLVSMKGIGRKVADCILLFGFDRKNVFPVDTWICQVYNNLICDNSKISAMKISNKLEQEFGEISGYIQQYLFYYKREKNSIS